MFILAFEMEHENEMKLKLGGRKKKEIDSGFTVGV